MIPNTGIKEVHTPVGPNGDIAIAMRFDEEDGLVFGRALIPHVCGMASRVKYKLCQSPQRDPEQRPSWTQVVDTTSSRRIEPRNLD